MTLCWRSCASVVENPFQAENDSTGLSNGFIDCPEILLYLLNSNDETIDVSWVLVVNLETLRRMQPCATKKGLSYAESCEKFEYFGKVGGSSCWYFCNIRSVT